jgi:hypothetical protein
MALTAKQSLLQVGGQLLLQVAQDGVVLSGLLQMDNCPNYDKIIYQ